MVSIRESKCPIIQREFFSNVANTFYCLLHLMIQTKRRVYWMINAMSPDMKTAPDQTSNFIRIQIGPVFSQVFRKIYPQLFSQSVNGSASLPSHPQYMFFAVHPIIINPLHDPPNRICRHLITTC